MNKLREKLTLACMLAITITILVSTIPAQAFDPSEWVWPSGTPYRSPHKYYRTTTIWSEFSTAINDWSGTHFGTMQISSSPDDAVATVRARDEGDTGTLGYWDPLNHSGWTLYTARITFNSYYSGNLTSSQKREVCGHELGHDLGLNEAADWYPKQIMWPAASENWAREVYTPQTYQNADIWGVNSIY